MNKSKVGKPSKRMVDLVPLYRIEDGGRIATSYGYMNIVELCPRNLRNEDRIEQDDTVETLAEFYRSYKDDFKFIFMNFPAVTTLQQAHIQGKLNNTDHPFYREILEDKLEELEIVTREITDRECYIMFFAERDADYKRNMDLMERRLGNIFRLQEIDIEKKELVLSKIGNMNSTIIF